jgi:uncharacterized membrane protein YfcA
MVSVPLLERAAGYSQQRAQAMVLLMLVPASAIGLVVYSSAGHVRWKDALALALVPSRSRRSGRGRRWP